MNNKGIVIGVVGILVGFVLGFFVAQISVQPAPSTPPPGAQASSDLPDGHPTPEMMAKVQEMEVWASQNPEDSESRIALGNLYYDMRRYDAAIKWYEESIKLQPGNVNVMTDLATAYLYTGNTARAVGLYQKSLEIDPEHAQTLQNLGVAYFYSGQFSDAVNHWEKLLKTHPEYPHRKEIQEQIQKARDHINEGTPQDRS